MRVRFFEIPRMLANETTKKLADLRQAFEDLREETSKQPLQVEDGGAKRVRMQEFDGALETLKNVIQKDWPEQA